MGAGNYTAAVSCGTSLLDAKTKKKQKKTQGPSVANCLQAIALNFSSPRDGNQKIPRNHCQISSLRKTSPRRGPSLSGQRDGWPACQPIEERAPL